MFVKKMVNNKVVKKKFYHIRQGVSACVRLDPKCPVLFVATLYGK